MFCSKNHPNRLRLATLVRLRKKKVARKKINLVRIKNASSMQYKVGGFDESKGTGVKHLKLELLALTSVSILESQLL